jgi:hypothetical protein
VRADALAEPRVWSIPEVEYKVDQVRTLSKTGGASLVALGSSAIDVALDPDQLSPRPGLRPAYNGGIGGSSIKITADWGELKAIPLLKPDVVIVGMTSREFNPNDPHANAFHQDFDRSPAIRELTDTDNALQRVERSAEDASALFKYRTVLRQPRYLWNLIGLGNAPRKRPYGQVSAAGHKVIYLKDTYADKEQLYKASALFRWELGRTERAKFTQLMEYLQANVKHVLVVSMPVTHDYIRWTPHGQADLDEVNAVLRRVAVATGAEFVETGVWPNELFADAGHVNAAGTARFTKMINAELARLGWR